MQLSRRTGGVILAASAGRALHGVTQPDHAPFQRLPMGEAKRLPGTGAVTLGTVIVDDALRSGDAVDGRVYQRAEFIDQFVLEERAIDAAAALEKELLHPEH